MRQIIEVCVLKVSRKRKCSAVNVEENAEVDLALLLS